MGMFLFVWDRSRFMYEKGVCCQDPQMRNAFIDRIAVPIANKMFECGMIP
jgi:hypothetical protein